MPICSQSHHRRAHTYSKALLYLLLHHNPCRTSYMMSALVVVFGPDGTSRTEHQKEAKVHPLLNVSSSLGFFGRQKLPATLGRHPFPSTAFLTSRRHENKFPLPNPVRRRGAYVNKSRHARTSGERRKLQKKSPQPHQSTYTLHFCSGLESASKNMHAESQIGNLAPFAD